MCDGDANGESSGGGDVQGWPRGWLRGCEGCVGGGRGPMRCFAERVVNHGKMREQRQSDEEDNGRADQTVRAARE